MIQEGVSRFAGPAGEAGTFTYHKELFCGILGLLILRDAYRRQIGPLMTEPQVDRAKSDTSPEARRVLYDLYRRMPLGRRLELVLDMCDTGRALAIAGLRMRHPRATKEELQTLWARQHLGRELFDQVYGGQKRG
jgi:hypothetical protein